MGHCGTKKLIFFSDIHKETVFNLDLSCQGRYNLEYSISVPLISASSSVYCNENHSTQA